MQKSRDALETLFTSLISTELCVCVCVCARVHAHTRVSSNRPTHWDREAFTDRSGGCGWWLKKALVSLDGSVGPNRRTLFHSHKDSLFLEKVISKL